MNLYPHLARSPDVERLARELACLSIAECRRRRATSHRRAVYLATGGTARASEPHLLEIAAGLSAIAERRGYPQEQARYTETDAEWSEFLHRNLRVTPHQAAHDGMWHFMTLVLVPDLVRWRWGVSQNADQVSDRWVTTRYRQRNTFGRLWWRCAILTSPNSPEPHRLIHALGEDELVQIMERPSLAGNRRLSRTTADILLKFAEADRDLNRPQLLRDQQKRILRLGAFVEFQVLSDESLAEIVRHTFEESVASLREEPIGNKLIRN